MKKTLLVSVLLSLLSYLSAQTPYENAMNSAMENWKKAKTAKEVIAVSNQFERIANKESDNWIPGYYAILTRVTNAFALEKEEAFNELEKVESDYQNLVEISDNDEVKVLKGMFLTVKVAKDPMIYAPTLSEEIMKTYQIALKENPENPRAMLILAEYEMEGAKYWGKDPKSYCSEIEKSIELFKSEKSKDFSPKWGLERAEQVFETNCKE